MEIAPTENESDDLRDRRIAELLEFTYRRIVKLDQERRYARYYCELLQPFRTTLIAFNFQFHGYPIHLDLPPLQMDDKVIPGETARTIPEYEHAYDIDSLMELLRRASRRVKKS